MKTESFLQLLVVLSLSDFCTAQVGFKKGVLLGASIGSVSGRDAPANRGCRTSTVHGAYAEMRWSDFPIALRPELKYAVKGYTVGETFVNEAGGYTYAESQLVGYLQVPLLARFTAFPAATVQPYAAIGPQANWLLKFRTQGWYLPWSGPLANQKQFYDSDLTWGIWKRSVMWEAVACIGVEADLGVFVSAEVRYDYGLTSMKTDGTELYDRSISLSIGIAI